MELSLKKMYNSPSPSIKFDNSSSNSTKSSKIKLSKIKKQFNGYFRNSSSYQSSSVSLPQNNNSMLTSKTNFKKKLKDKIRRIIFDVKDKPSPKKNGNIYSRTTLSFSSPRMRNNNKFTEISQEMTDKYILGTGNVYPKDLNPTQISKKNFKNLLIRDFGIIKDHSQRENIERSKMMYMRENEFNQEKINGKDFLKKSLSLSEICKNSLAHYYNYRLIKERNKSKSISKEIQFMNCPEYQNIDCKETRNRMNVVNYHNLDRKIKVYNIEKYTYDIDNDDLGIKNLPKLKKQLKYISAEAIKHTGKVHPKFVKGKVKAETIKKYRSLLGLFFGIG